jgi:hypothetical protein
VSRSYPKIVRNRKHRIERRLDPKRRWSEQPAPMLSASNIHFEMAERDRAVNYGVAINPPVASWQCPTPGEIVLDLGVTTVP